MSWSAQLMTLTFLLSSFASYAWAGYGADLAERMFKYATLMESLHQKTITKMNSAMLSKTNNTMSYTATLYSGNDYVVYAFGDNRIKDTDLVVYRKDSSGSWVQVKRDVDTNNLAIVEFHCYTQGEYKFEVKAYEFESDYSRGYYGLIIGF